MKICQLTLRVSLDKNDRGFMKFGDVKIKEEFRYLPFPSFLHLLHLKHYRRASFNRLQK